MRNFLDLDCFISFTFSFRKDDLVGEAVLPVSDLCSSVTSKRVIQLHRFGQTKTGSITAEVLFVRLIYLSLRVFDKFPPSSLYSLNLQPNEQTRDLIDRRTRITESYWTNIIQTIFIQKVSEAFFS